MEIKQFILEFIIEYRKKIIKNLIFKQQKLFSDKNYKDIIILQIIK